VEVPMGEKRDTTGKKVRPKTAAKGKRYLCAKCRKRSPRAIYTPAPWYCPNCLKSSEPPAS
jgi:late competence protein required for DNA uptake (superfamily II DNA/RNA helicase)